VKTGDSTLLLQEVQAEGGECVTPRWRIGTRLGTNMLDYLRVLSKRLKAMEESLRERNANA
jgi:hypothetical protein